MQQILDDFRVFIYLSICFGLILMSSMRFKEMYLSDTNERPGLFRLVTEGIDNLEGLQWEVAVGAYP